MQSTSFPPQPLLLRDCFAELSWPASEQMIPRSETEVEMVMWRKRDTALQFHSLQPVGDIVSALWWGRPVLFGAFVGHAVQEQFPPGTGAQKRLQGYNLGGRIAHPYVGASCKLRYVWCSAWCFRCSQRLAGPLKHCPGKRASGEGTALFFVPLVGHAWWCEGGIFSLPMSRGAS